MIKTVSIDSAQKCAKSMGLEENDYMLFNLGKTAAIVCGSEGVFDPVFTVTAENFVDEWNTRLYDANPSDDEEADEKGLKHLRLAKDDTKELEILLQKWLNSKLNISVMKGGFNDKISRR